MTYKVIFVVALLTAGFYGFTSGDRAMAAANRSVACQVRARQALDAMTHDSSDVGYYHASKLLTAECGAEFAHNSDGSEYAK